MTQHHLAEAFAATVTAHPERIAVTDPQGSWTYAELDDTANRLAAAVRQHSPDPTRPVGILLERSKWMVAAALAVLRTGASYVPLDPQTPAARLQLIADDAQPALVITERSLAGLAPGGVTAVHVDEPLPEAGPAEPAAIDGDTRAYLIFTSGTTGRPKGVQVSHGNVLSLFTSARQLYDFGPEDVWSLFHSFAFDVSVWEMWGALLHGGRLVVVPAATAKDPAAMRQLLHDEKVTVLSQTPTAFQQLWAEDARHADLLPLRWIVFAGEPLYFADLRVWVGKYGDEAPRLVNMYGITETTVHSSFRRVRAADLRAGSSLIGRPLPGSEFLLLNDDLSEVGAGEVGEIVVTGPGVSLGYLNRPELNRERFVDLPAGRGYRSGDLARWTGEEFEYHGRKDDQVKIRGFRIELGEIRTALTDVPGVQQAVVITTRPGATASPVVGPRSVSGEITRIRSLTRGGGPARVTTADSTPRIVAYIVATGDLDPDRLYADLRQRLPHYMIPAFVIPVGALPTTANGKIDKARLPAPTVAGSLRPAAGPGPGDVPRTGPQDTVRALVALYEDVLDVTGVTADDSFFSVGGDSILALKLRADAERQGLTLELADLYALQTPAALAAVTGRTTTAQQPVAPFSLLTPADRERLTATGDVEDAYPVGTLQAGLLFHSAYVAGVNMYCDVFSFRIRDAYDHAAMERAIARLVDRHDILRTSFDLTGYGEPLQLVHRTATVRVARSDLRHLPAAEQQTEVTAWHRREEHVPYDWAVPPLSRFHTHILGEQEFLFSMSFHDALLDGWSEASLMTELLGDYWAIKNGQETPAAPRTARRYADFIALEQQALRDPQARDFWTAELDGVEPTLLPRLVDDTSDVHEGTVGFLSVDIDPDLSDDLDQVARSAGVTARHLLIAAHARVVATLTGRDDIVLSVMSNGRPEDEGGTDVYGLHLNMVPYRMRTAGLTWNDLIHSALEKETALLPVRRYPLAEIQRHIGIRELTDISFNYTYFHSYQRLAATTGLQVLDATAYIHTNFTLRAEFNRDPFTGHLALDLEGNMNRVSEPQLRTIAALYRSTLESIAAGAHRVPTRRELLGDEQWRALVAGFGDPTPQPLPAHGWFELFERAAAEHADRTAAICGPRTLTYRQLAERVGGLATHLTGLGAGPGTVIGLGAGRDLDFLTAAMAIMRIGAIYLPLPDGPVPRVASMLRTSEAALVLAGDTFAGPLTAAAGDRTTVLDLGETLAAAAGRPPYTGPVPGGRDSAYVTFTSGSTGEPKGALIRHDGMLNHIEAKVRALDIAAGDLVSQDAAATFDISVWQMLAPLGVGGATVIYPDAVSQDPPRLLRALAADGVTVLEVSPSVLAVVNAELTYYGVDAFTGLALRWVVCAGEALPPRTVNTFRRLLPQVRFLNMWGATEISDDVTHYEVRDDIDERIASVQLGRPIRNGAVYVLDDNREPVPVGTPGELYVGGIVVGAGYLNDPERTAHAFVPDPVTGDPGLLAYRTGDRARQLADGGYEFLGRIDSQLKIRGQRVEIGEIEAALAALDDLQESAVIARTYTESRGKQLAAFYVPKVAAGTPEQGRPRRLDVTPADVRDRLTAVLPRYAVPDFLIRLDELPRNTNGKVDTKALAARDVGSLVGDPAGHDEQPAPGTETAVADTWASVLRLAHRPGATTDFFELGGHSLHATQVMARLRDRFGVDLPVRTLFENPTPRALAALVDAGAGATRPAPLTAVAIPARPAGTVEFPLAGNQASLWFLNQVDPDDRSYEGVSLLHLRGRVDVDALRHAVDTLADRHEILSVRFHVRDGVPYQAPSAEARVRLETEEVTGVAADPAARKAYVVRQAAGRRFDLERGPLAVIRLYSFSATDHILEWSTHHVVSDGWSIDVAVREITEAYLAHQQGRRPDLPELPVQYGDYARWQRQHAEATAGPEADFWRSYLAGYPGELPLPTDHERTEDRARTPGHLTRAFDEDTTGRLAAFTREHRTTLFMVVQAATAVVMSRLAGQPDVVLGTGVAGRAVPGTEHLLGFFTNTLPCRYRLEPGAGATELVRSVSSSALAALEHQLTPFQDVVRAAGTARHPGVPPLVQVLVTVDNYPMRLRELPGLTAALEQLPPRTSMFDLLLRFTEGDRLRLDVQYDATLFTAATVERTVDAVARILDVFLDEPDRDLDTVPLATGPEPTRHPARHLGEAFAAVVAEHPDRIAVQDGRETWTYRRLDETADRLAAALTAASPDPARPVGILLDRSAWMVAAALAVVRTGSSYLPLDPDSPPARLELILKDARPAALITSRALAAGAPGDIPAVLVDGPLPDGVPAGPAAIDGDTRAYLIFTSGTTGRPKGVQVSHGNLLSLFAATEQRYDFGPGDVWTLFHTFSFDFSVWEMWGALLYGGRLVVVPAATAKDPVALRGLLRDENVTVLCQTPSAFTALAAEDTRVADRLPLRWVIFGGERLHFADLQSWMAKYGDEAPRLVNMYGITETTVHSSFRRVRAADLRAGSSLIGHPLPGSDFRLLNDDLSEVGAGEVGEIVVTGPGVSLGYLDRPELNRERFVDLPAGRGYRSGDLARWTGEEFEYHGRKDDQVKIRGFRIELGEIEQALRALPGLTEAAVVARDLPGRGTTLIAYAVGEVPADQIRAALADTLPGYMIPSHYVALDRLPTTANGKTDRNALPEPALPPGAGDGPEPAADEVEERILRIIRDLLHLESADPATGFFDLGGHSLLATRLLAAVRTAFAVEVPLREFLREPTARALATVVRDRLTTPSGATTAVAMLKAPGPAHQPATDAQQRLYFLSQLEPDSAAYHVHIPLLLEGDLDVAALEGAFTAVVRRHAPLRTVFRADDDGLVQIVRPAAPVRLTAEPLPQYPGEDWRDSAARLAHREATRPFDLHDDPMIRVRLIRVAPALHVLLVTMHHIAADGWSVAVLSRELKAHYAHREVPAEPPYAFTDFAHSMREWLAGPQAERDLAYWAQRLAGLPAVHRLPLDHPRPARTNAADTVTTTLSGPVADAIRRTCREENVTLFVLLQSALSLLLARRSGSDDIVLGTAVAGRPAAELDDLIGMFVNTLVLRTRLDRAGSFGDLLAQVREQTGEDLERQHVPLAVLHKHLNPPYSPDHAPLFQIMLVLQNNEAAALDFDGLDVTPLPSPDLGAQAELMLDAVEKNGELVLRWRYSTGLFTADTVTGLAAQFDRLLTDMCGSAERRSAPLDPPGDQHALVRLRQNPDGAPPVFALPGVLGLGASFTQLSSYFADRSFFAVSTTELMRTGDGDGDGDATTLADRCARLIAATTGGPVHLVGHSYGGSLALHVAERLRQRGVPVAGLVLLDALDPVALAKALSGGPDDQFTAFVHTLGAVFPDLAPHRDTDVRQLLRTESAGAILRRLEDIIGPHAVEFFPGGLEAAFRTFRRMCDLDWPATGPVGLPALLVRADRFADSSGWAPHLSGALRVADIDADHEGMLRNPHARDLAGILRRFFAEHDGGMPR